MEVIRTGEDAYLIELNREEIGFLRDIFSEEVERQHSPRHPYTIRLSVVEEKLREGLDSEVL
jgi:hypothetical protein